MTAIHPALKKMREFCLSLPETREALTETWSSPHFRVKDKPFAGFGPQNGKSAIGFKLLPEHARDILTDPRFWKPPYVGHLGWVSMDADSIKAKDWPMVRSMILESYRLTAPKKLAERAKEVAA